MTTLYNANPRSAYRSGFFTGTHRVDDVLRHGDFGVGALDRNDGELVVLDGVAYRTAEDGTTHEVDWSATTPLTTVLPFRAETCLDVSGPLDRDAFEDRVRAWLPLENRMWALRIHGDFEHVTAGASAPQDRPYRELPEVMEDYRRVRHEDTRGTLVAFHSPAFQLGTNYLGFHYHWISDDRTQGGHVFDLAVRDVVVEAAEAHAFTVDVATDPELLALDLTPRQ